MQARSPRSPSLATRSARRAQAGHRCSRPNSSARRHDPDTKERGAMKRLMSRAALAVALAPASASTAAQQPIVIKFSHVVAQSTPKGQAAERFKQLAEERTKGRVKVEVYPNSQLYKEGEEVDALQLGAVQMLAPSTSKFGPLGLPQFELFDLPYIFPNREVLHRVTLGPLGKALFKRLESKGIAGLGYGNSAFKGRRANKPLHAPADYKGLKMR